MTAADQPTPRVGEFTAEQAHQALAMVSRWVARYAKPAGDQRVLTDQLIYVQETLHALTRLPGAPQPAPTTDAVERAARAAWVRYVSRIGKMSDARAAFNYAWDAALDAVRAGQAEHGPDWSDWRDDHPEEGPSCRCGFNGTPEECAAHRAAQRSVEAVDREAIAAVHVAIPNSDVGGPLLCARCMFAWPCDAARLATRGDAPAPAVDREALADILRVHHWHTGKPSTERCRCGAPVPWIGDAGEDIRRHQADVILAARGDASPTVTAEQVRRQALRDALTAVETVAPYSEAHGDALVQAEDSIRALIEVQP